MTHTFTSSDADWGFSQMALIREIEDPNNGFLVDAMVKASAPPPFFRIAGLLASCQLCCGWGACTPCWQEV